MITSPRRPTSESPASVPVAVIVIGWNAAKYLAECLQSIARQTSRPQEIVFVDDASEDHTAEIAASFSGVKLIRLQENGGMSNARMAGFAETTAPFLLFVDSDNVLPPDYLARMWQAIQRGHELVYPGKRYICESGQSLPDWIPNREGSRAALWQQNFVDTCALMRRETFVKAGGWRWNRADTMFDWDLALRISSSGSIGFADVLLGYRVHGDNWSSRDRGSWEDLLGTVRRAAASVTVATVWSGRLGNKFFFTWLRAIERAVKCAGSPPVDFLILDDSPDPLCPSLDVFGSGGVSIRRIHSGEATATRRPDRRATAEFLAAQFQTILTESRGDVVWMVEDDILPARETLDKLLNELIGRPKIKAAVTGAYQARHGDPYYVAACLTGGRVVHYRELPPDPVPVDFAGTGCLAVLRDYAQALGARFAIEWTHQARRSPAHDWAFAWQLKQAGSPVHLVPDAPCEHVA